MKLLQKIGRWLWSFLRFFGRTMATVLSFLASYISNRREFAIWPFVFGLVLVLLAGAVFLATGRAVIASLDPLFDQLLNLAGIVAVIAIVGAMKTKGYLLSDIADENSPKTPWQKVVGSDFACVTLIVALSWLVLSR